MRIFLSFFSKTGLHFKSIFKRDIENIRNQFCDSIHFAVGNIERTPNVSDHAFGHHFSEGADLRDFVFSILLCHVFNNLTASFLAEVDVNIRHTDSVRIKKTFKKQPVAKRVNIRDSDGIGHKRTRGGATPGTHRHIIVFCVLDKIGNDQKITGKTHFLDDFQFAVQTLEVSFPNGCLIMIFLIFHDDRHELLQPFLCLAIQIIFQGFFRIFDFEFRKQKLTKFKCQIATFSNSDGVGKRLGRFRKKRLHFFRGADIELIGGHGHPVGVFNGFSRLDTQQDIVRLGMFDIQIMTVIGGNQGNRQFPAQFDQSLVGNLLIGNPVFHDFQIEIVFTENIAVFNRGLPGLIHVAPYNVRGNFAVQAGA